jgi:hypothetical protein
VLVNDRNEPKDDTFRIQHQTNCKSIGAESSQASMERFPSRLVAISPNNLCKALHGLEPREAEDSNDATVFLLLQS